MANAASIRLATLGKDQVKADFSEVSQAGTDSFKRVGDEAEAQARRWERAEAKANRTIEEGRAALERAQAKRALFSGTAPGNPTPANDQSAKAAEQSARIAAAAYEQLQRRADSLVAAIDPAFAAQQRFNREMGEARGLVSAGVLSLDQYVAKLRLEQDALDAVGKTGKRTGNAFAAAAPQIQDLFTQISMGGNPVNALVVQGGQLAGQLQYAGGKAQAFANVLMGPVGIGFQVALLLLSPLLGKMLDFSNATDDAIDKLKKDATQTEATRIAKERFSKTAEGVAAAIREGTAATLKGIEADKSSAEQANINAKNNLAEEISIRRKTLAKLADAKAAANEMLGDDPGIGAQIGRDLRVANLEKQLKTQEELIKAAEARVQETRIALAGDAAARMADPLARIKKQYDDQAAAARNAARAAVKGGQEVTAALTLQLAAIERNRAAAIKAEQDKQKAGRETTRRDPDTVTSNQVAKLLRAELPGVRIGSTTRTPEHNREVGGAPNSYHVKGNAIDFTPAGGMGSMTKDDVRRIFTARGIDVLELLGPGDRGHSDHFHVAWTKGKQSLDDFNDAAKRNKDAQDDLAKANRVLDDDLRDVVKKFDPARAAADEYAMSLKKIAALRGAGKITADQAGDYTYALLKEQQTKAAAQQVASFKTMFGDIEDPFAAGNASWRVQQDEQISAWTVEHERRQQVQQEGVRTVAGLYRNLMSGGTRSIFDSFKEMGIDAIAQLAAKWTMSQIGKLAGSSGFIGSLASLISGKPKVGANASGTEYWSGGMSLVGENGPEIVSMARGSRVTPAAETRRMLSGSSNSRGGHTIIINANDAVLAETVRGWVAQGIDIGAARGAAGGSEMAGRNLSLAQNRALA